MKKIYLTVDTECHDINKLNLYIYGKKGKDSFGLPQILEIGKELNIPINFFLDVSECHRYGDKYVQDIVNLIHKYNQPIYFHFHPNFVNGDDERSFLWQYTEEEQRDLLKIGLNDYYRFCGKKDKLIFRAGRYGINETTIKLLNELGIEVLDLSYFSFSSGMCHLSTKIINTFNHPKKVENVTLLPNTTFVGLDYFGRKHTFILNVAQTTLNEFSRFISMTKLEHVVFTMHSWDFIRKWFFLQSYMQGDKFVIKKFKKCVSVAQSNGFVFSKLDDFEYNTNQSDELYNLCRDTKGKLLGVVNNYKRFYSIGRLTPKYFIVTRGIVLISMIFVIALCLLFFN